jgi:hypothetical protein
VSTLHDEYVARVRSLSDALGGMRAVSRALGISGHGTLQYRLDRPAAVRMEHVLAARMLARMISGPEVQS